MDSWVPLLESRQLPAEPGIYVIRHIETGKEYVGLSKNVQQRVSSHRSAPAWHYFGRALKSHGLDKFEACFLVGGKLADLGRLEQETIAARGTMVPAGYNIAAGGDGPTGVAWSDERKAAQVARLLGGRHSTEAIEKMRQNALKQNGFKGKKHSQESLAKISAATIAAHTGMRRSAETCARIGAAKTKRVAIWQTEGLLPWKIFESLKEASAWAGAEYSLTAHWCTGRRRPPKGQLWSYI